MFLTKEMIKPPALEKEAFIIAQARKEPAAFQALYDFYYQPIFRFLYTRLGQEEEAADLCSSVFLKAIINLPNYQDKGYPFGSWLYKIAYNELLQYFREHKRQRNLLIGKEFLEDLYPDSNNEKEVLLNRLNEAIQELSYQEAQLIELKYWDKKAYKEIAFIMDISIANAKTKMSRIYKKLGQKLQKYLP